eukprot:CAMPEP_0116098540 /NCGR_PEP_ID=MMETSP0327-20121206/11291_1 /TAXON_ID=44447 /ORGANISM="Pseudo-nitzschia delicatissima, Strain B596" /LENGTH=54 /DNA_ID=CAMNT_0003590361 /DNA_START=21 /DNA_END=182 /DNA_ORIENTATION=+
MKNSTIFKILSTFLVMALTFSEGKNIPSSGLLAEEVDKMDQVDVGRGLKARKGG